MARLLNWPNGLGAKFREPLAGPRSERSGASESVIGFQQTYSSPFGAWAWRFVFPPMRGSQFRRYRGLVTALHGGVNAVRVPFCDWDGLSFEDRGVDATEATWLKGQPWGNQKAWENGKNWASSSPLVRVVATSARDSSEIRLGSEFFGHNLDIGDFLGFAPFHFGLYTVTEVFAPGHYRIWPKLRKAIAPGDLATLEPVLAMRLASEDGAALPRDAVASSDLSITLIECLDYDVRDYWKD